MINNSYIPQNYSSLKMLEKNNLSEVSKLQDLEVKMNHILETQKSSNSEAKITSQQIKSLKWETYFFSFAFPYFIFLFLLTGILLLLHYFITIKISHFRFDIISFLTNETFLIWLQTYPHFWYLSLALFFFFLWPFLIIFKFFTRQKITITSLTMKQQILDIKTYYKKPCTWFWLFWTLPFIIIPLFKLFKIWRKGGKT